MTDTVNRKIFYVFSFSLMLILFFITAFYSYGYDDEISSIKIVENSNSAVEIIKYINSIDFHPFGMYIINYFLLLIFKNWSLVRAAGGLFAASVIWLYWLLTFGKIKDKTSLIFSYAAVCLCPSVLLWCTSVRWYTYLTPLVCLTAFMIQNAGSEKISPYKFWILYSLNSLLMFHINYLAAVIISVSFFCIIYKRKKFLRREWKFIAFCIILSACIASYQVYALLTVHLKNSGGNFFHLMAFLSGGLNFLSGQAVMPFSLFGIFLIISNLILFILFSAGIKKFVKSENIFFILSYALIMIMPSVGLVQARSFVILSPLKGAFLSDVYKNIKNKNLRLFVLCAFILGTCGGIYNVAAHTNTSKANYNIPYGDLMACAAELSAGKDTLLISNNPVILYMAEKNKIKTIFLGEPNWYETLENWPGSIIAVETFIGVTSVEDFSKYLSFIKTHKASFTRDFGSDDFAYIKRKFIKDYPDYLARIYFIEK